MTTVVAKDRGACGSVSVDPPQMPIRWNPTWRAAMAVCMTLVATYFSDAPPAFAAQFGATSTPVDVVFPTTREVTYRVSIVADASDETLEIEQGAPTWGEQAIYRAGAPAYHVQTSLEGPGQFTPAPIAVPTPPGPSRGLVLPCDGAERFAPRPPLGSRRGTLRLPAGAQTTLATTWRLSSQAPFASTDYRPRLTATRGNMSQDIFLPRPRIVGPTGVPIRLLTSKQGRAGRTMKVRGRTNPALVGERISLRLIGPIKSNAHPAIVASPGKFRTVARARVDRLGRFEYRWHPRRAGLYGAYPDYPGRPPAILRDRGCPVLIKIR